MGSSREDRQDEGPRLASPLPFPGFSLVPSPTPVSAGFSCNDNWSSDNCKCRNNSSFRVGDYHGSSNHNGSSNNNCSSNNNGSSNHNGGSNRNGGSNHNCSSNNNCSSDNSCTLHRIGYYDGCNNDGCNNSSHRI